MKSVKSVADPQVAAELRRRRLELAALLGLLVVAALVRLYYAPRERVAWGDEPFYLWLGRSLWAGDGYNIFGYSGASFPPLFPVLAGGLALVTGGLLSASNLIYVLSGALLILPLYALSRSIYGLGAALATALVVAVYPALTSGVLTWGTLSEPLYLLWVGVAIYALYRALDAQPSRTRDYVFLAVALGLAYLTRTEALVFAVVAFGLLGVVRLVRRDRLAAVLGRLALAGILFLLVASPYLLYIRNQTGRWSFTGAAGMAYVSMKGLAEDNTAAFDQATWELDPASGEVYLFAPASEMESLGAAILSDPRQLAARLATGTKDMLNLLFSDRLAPWPLAALAVLGLFGQAWTARRLRGELALLASLASPLSYVPFFVQERYLAGLLLPAMVWSGAGGWLLGRWLAGTWANLRAGRVSPRLALALTALPMLLITALLLWEGQRLFAITHGSRFFQRTHLAAAAELRAQGAPAGAVVMSRYPAVAFHAGTRWAPTPAEAWPDVAAYARRHGARYLVFDQWEGTLRPQLSFLFLPNQAPPELRYITTVEDSVNPAVIYEFK